MATSSDGYRSHAMLPVVATGNTLSSPMVVGTITILS